MMFVTSGLKLTPSSRPKAMSEASIGILKKSYPSAQGGNAMPNWAYTQYKVRGREDEVMALHKMIKDLEQREESLLPNGFGKLWLGNLVHILGGDWEKIYCRGEIMDYSLENGILTMNTETAWGELSEVRHFLQSKYPSLEIYFQTEEPGMCVFQTNNSEIFPEKWLLDWNDEKNSLYIWEYFTDLPAVIEYLKNNGVLTKDVYPSKGAITAALDEIQNSRPNDISYMLEEFIKVSD